MSLHIKHLLQTGAVSFIVTFAFFAIVFGVAIAQGNPPAPPQLAESNGSPSPTTQQILGDESTVVPEVLPAENENITSPSANLTTTPKLLTVTSATPQPTSNSNLLASSAITNETKPAASPLPLPSPEATPTVSPKPIPSLALKAIPLPTPISSPIPTPLPSPTTPVNLEELFTLYANKESVSRVLLRKIAVCESNLNSLALSRFGYAGLYQFSENAWKSTRRVMNLNPDPALRFNAEEAIKTAAFKIATGGTGAWPECSK